MMFGNPVTELLAKPTLEFSIADWVPDRHLLINARNRTHWQVIRKHKDAAKERVSLFIRMQKPSWLTMPFGQAHVTVTFEFPQKRRRDPDNLAGMVKPCLDALVDEGILVDDDCAHIDLTLRAKATGRYATTIHITGWPAEHQLQQASF